MITTEQLDANVDNFSLEDLSGEEFSLSDLSTSPMNNIKIGESSNKQLAASTAFLKGDPALAAQAMQDIDQEMSSEGTRVKQTQVMEEAKAESMATTQDALVDVLLDDSLSDEQKIEATRFALDKTSEMFSVRKQLTTKLLSKTLSSNNAEVERVRINTTTLVDEVNDQLEAKQKLLNQRVAAVDVNLAGSVVEFFENALPLGRQKLIGNIVADLKEQLGEDSLSESGRVKSFLALGESVEDIQNLLKSTPVKERHNLTKILADIIDSNSEIVIPDENGYAKVDLLRTFLEEGYYEETDKWVDNVIGILDIVVLGGAAKMALKRAKGSVKPARTLDDIISDLKTKRTFFNDSATSAGRNAENANPDTARIMFDSSVSNDKVAQAFYGATEAEVAARGINPKPIIQGTPVEVQPSQMGRNGELELIGDPDMLEWSKTDGKIYYSQDELKRMRSQVFHDFENVNGLTLRENLTRAGRDESDNVSIKAVYAPNADSGWESAQDALEQTMFGLRKYGLKDSDVTLLVRSGSEYVPVKSSDTLPTTGDFIVEVNYKYEYNPLDLVTFDKVDVNLNLFDRTIGQIEISQGANLSRLVKDASSMFDFKISGGALRAEDRSAAIERKMVGLAKEFDSVYLKLPNKSQISLDEYIKEANHKGIKFNKNYLKGRGFNDDEIKALEEFKRYWDTVYVLENSDMTRTLNAQGWELWDNGTSTLLTRRVARNQLSGIREYYDPVKDAVVRYSDDNITELYKTGTVVELRTAIDVDGKTITHMAMPQNSDNYTRRIRESDHILNYRHSYYTVKNEANWFIDKNYLDDSGNVIKTETVASAGSQKEADKFISRASKQEENVSFVVRADRNKGRTVEDDHISVAINNGRTPQRFRGKRLRDASGTSDVNQKYIKDPVEVMIESARSISNRVGYRDYLETTKRRFVETYGHLLPTNKGRRAFPSSKSEISGKDQPALKRDYQDAAQTWEYLNFLENAYVNGIDEIYKSVMRELAEVVGKKSAKGEELLMGASKQNPTALIKNVAFQSLLAMNPMRQFVIQSHQSVQLAAIAPVFVGTKLARQMTGLIQYKLGLEDSAAAIFGVSKAELAQIVKAFDDSGLMANVSRHSLVQGSLTQMADSWSVGSKIQRAASAVMSTPRKVGFDAGEFINMSTAWLTFRHRAIEAGKDFSNSRVQAEVAALARDFTYGMNFAGDMMYNQNAVAMIMQFTQAAHKAVLQITSNRNWTKAEKAKLASFMLINYTLPPVVMYTAFAPLLAMVEDETTRDAIVFGFESFLINTAATAITGEKTRVDFSGLSSLDMYGVYEILTELWVGEGLGEALANSPSAGLLLGHNPRIKDAFMGAARFFHLAEDEGQTPEDLLQVAEGFMSISSGYSNYMKWSYANEVGKKLSSTGKLTHTSKFGTLMTLFGFPEQEETKKYLFNKMAYEKSKSFEDDFNKWYGENKRVLAKRGISNEDEEFRFRMINSALLHFRQHPERFNDLLMKKLQQDAKEGDMTIYESAKRLMGITSKDEFISMIQSAPMPEEVRKNLIDTMKLLQELKDEEVELDKKYNNKTNKEVE